MKTLRFAIYVACVVLAADSTALCDNVYVVSLTSSGTFAAAPGATIEVPVSVNFSGAQDDPTNPMQAFDLDLAYDSSVLTLPGNWCQWAPGSVTSPSFKYANSGWTMLPGPGGDDPVIISASANADTISNVSGLGTLPTLDLYLTVNSNASPGTTSVSISGLYPTPDGPYSTYFDSGSGIQLQATDSIQLTIVPEPASFALLAVALTVGGGFLAVRRLRSVSSPS